MEDLREQSFTLDKALSGSTDNSLTEYLNILPGESQGRGNPVGCRLWGRTESDMMEAT